MSLSVSLSLPVLKPGDIRKSCIVEWKRSCHVSLLRTATRFLPLGNNTEERDAADRHSNIPCCRSLTFLASFWSRWHRNRTLSETVFKYGSKLHSCTITVIARPLVRISVAVSRITSFASQYSVNWNMKLNFHASYRRYSKRHVEVSASPVLFIMSEARSNMGLFRFTSPQWKLTLLRISLFVLCAWRKAKQCTNVTHNDGFYSKSN